MSARVNSSNTRCLFLSPKLVGKTSKIEAQLEEKAAGPVLRPNHAAFSFFSLGSMNQTAVGCTLSSLI
jgi:hypothetical protein